jgi:hypothetical protein
MADRDRLMQVMVNLLSNALKFVPADSGRVTVGARAATASEVRVTVGDNGPASSRGPGGDLRQVPPGLRAPPTCSPTSRRAPASGCRSAARSSSISTAGCGWKARPARGPALCSHCRGSRAIMPRRMADATAAGRPRGASITTTDVGRSFSESSHTDCRRRAEHRHFARVPDEEGGLRGRGGDRRRRGLATGRRIHARPRPARRDDAEEVRLRGLPRPCAPIRPWRRSRWSC